MAQDAAEALQRAQQELQQPQLGAKSCRVPSGQWEYPKKIWPYMVQYLHLRILELPLIIQHFALKMDCLYI